MEVIQPMIAVVFVLALLVAVLAVLRKRGVVVLPSASGRTPQKRVEVVERIALTPQHSLHLVRVGDRCILMATAPTCCQVLDSFPEAGGRL